MTPAERARFDIARMFGKWPWEVGALPYRRYKKLRDYHEIMVKEQAQELKPDDKDGSSDDPLADAPWEAEAHTSLK